MTGITIDNFDDFFRELHGYEPYSWQRCLAEQTLAGDWPGAIDLPTGSGKTACIDIAIFALACQASLPVERRTTHRRIFFCVNRRIIVDEAHQRARRIARAIWQAERDDGTDKPILREVAKALRTLAGTAADHDTPPLDVLELRGGIYRDNRWARSISQPTIVCTTIDQLGSRLLFRGYGVSDSAAPIQAAMIAYDSLILLDEAHISEPFRQTLDNVQRYLDPVKWAEQNICVKPVCVVPMTATPSNEMRSRGVIELTDADRENPLLDARLTVNKPAELKPTSNLSNLIKDAVKDALELVKDKPTAVGIIVNRVATARAIYDALLKEKNDSGNKKRKIPDDAAIELVIGSMRPIDRDKQAERLRTLVGPGRPEVTVKTSFIVATQCLEVGADYDFDALITECASLDALRQRFGRLNRSGRDIEAKAVILANKKDIKPDDKLDKEKPLDPIYGNALARTWNWLCDNPTDTHKEKNGKKTIVRRWVDFGIDAFNILLDKHEVNGQLSKELLAPSALLNAPVMMPAYVDFWCQTAPKPIPDPDVSMFIHGPQGGEPDVQVCWRADLVEDDHMTRDQWINVVALLPPTAAECMSVPISRLRRWLTDQLDDKADQGDLLGIGEGNKSESGDDKSPLKHIGIIWRGPKESMLLESPLDISPGDTLVLPATTPGSNLLGHVPSLTVDDVAEPAFTRARDRAVLRLHTLLQSNLPDGEPFDNLFTAATNLEDQPSREDWSAMIRTASEALIDYDDEHKQALGNLVKKGIHVEFYPDRRGVVLTTRKRLKSSTDWFIPALDDGDDETSRIQREDPVFLADHSNHVQKTMKDCLACLPLSALADVYTTAAEFHDIGKADERFQAMLRRTDRTDAWLLAEITSSLLAKSEGMPQGRSQRKDARTRADLPQGFRHEMLSVQLTEISEKLPDKSNQRELLLHLIAAHHGYCRPFAPVVPDDELPAVEVSGISLSNEKRQELIPSHRIDSGVAERFWSLTRRFGWWGLAYLEAVLRLADQQASAAEDTGQFEPGDTTEFPEAIT